MATYRTLAEIQTSLEGQGFPASIPEIVSALKLPTDTNDSATSRVALKAVKAEIVSARAAQPASPVKAPRRKTAKKTTSARYSKASTVQSQRNSRQVKLDFNLSPIDRATLRTIQDEVNAVRKGKHWDAPEDWNPEDYIEGSAFGFQYETPKGRVDNVPTGDFVMMQNNKMPWATPRIEASHSDLHRWANMLSKLSFRTKVCELCRKPLSENESSKIELPKVYGLLDGRYILPYISEPFPNENSVELRFRRLHQLHSLWEDTLTKLLLRMKQATNEQIISDLLGEADNVLARAERNRPGEYNLVDVLASLEEVLTLWNGDDS